MDAATNGPPDRILLATDLSPRCDRALDRAAELAAGWGAALVVLHVLADNARDVSDPAAPLPSWRRPPDAQALARKRLLADLADLGPVGETATVLVAEGDPAEAIPRAADAEGCGLIVIGTGSDGLLGRLTLGRTVDRLLRRSRQPLLVVKGRPRGPYRRIVVATDLSESSRRALETAAAFFPDRAPAVFHAFDAPVAGLLSDPAAYRREHRVLVTQDCEAFLDRAGWPAAGGQPPDLLVEEGAPAALLRDYASETGVDLVVLGTHGRSAVFELVLGSVAKEIMEEVPCDALVIREPRAAVEA